MIIGYSTPPRRTLDDTNRLLNQIVKGRIEKMTNETIDEIDCVIRCLNNVFRNYKPFFIEHPEIYFDIKTQIDELKRINGWIKKEVE